MTRVRHSANDEVSAKVDPYFDILSSFLCFEKADSTEKSVRSAEQSLQNLLILIEEFRNGDERDWVKGLRSPR
ncbi:hypothetical protein H6G00_28140 [Leptolyngbya sp. FACHB-541]|uniref:hypothetical protein n=1 Tax=Leptolyngbya sp. FACHB-541 TaxID=2692810 RepID=UPI00168797C1|nr:hypothetical protein [Leptolyngbya sp. FACHB-541]MBD2000427.1 hypothetical protein [Leptolyngbya sp. FACHB-541]